MPMNEKIARMATPLENVTSLMSGWDPRNCVGENMTNALAHHHEAGTKSDLPRDLEKTIEAVIAADLVLDQTLVTLKARLGLSSGRTPEELCAEHGWRAYITLEEGQECLSIINEDVGAVWVKDGIVTHFQTRDMKKRRALKK